MHRFRAIGERDMQELPVTRDRVLAVWWLVVWRWVVGSFVLGSIVSVTTILVQVWAGTWRPSESPSGLGTFVALLASVLWLLVVVRMALRKRYREFRLVLVAAEPRADLLDLIDEVAKKVEERGH
jgi:hypothetical protein